MFTRTLDAFVEWFFGRWRGRDKGEVTVGIVVVIPMLFWFIYGFR